MTLIEQILNKESCRNRVRLLGFLWMVTCRGRLQRKESVIHHNRQYVTCSRCGDVQYKPRLASHTGLRKELSL